MKKILGMCSKVKTILPWSSLPGDKAEGDEESNVPTSHKRHKTELEQRNELHVVDSNVDGPEYTQKTTTSNPNELEAPGGIHGVQVSKLDATKLEQELKRELFGTWSERCEVHTAVKIPFKKFCGYLDYLQNAFEGFEKETREHLASILLTDEPWDQRLFEWKFNNAKRTGARYCMLVFDRSQDMEFINSMYVIYKMDFTTNPGEKDEDVPKLLLELFSWYPSGSEVKEHSHGTGYVPILQNFFRLKALEGLYQEGLVDKINYIDFPDSIEKKSSMEEESK